MKPFACFAAGIVMLSSCSPIYFTEYTRNRVQQSNTKNIEKIQFFNDTEISLVYKTSSGDEHIKGGKVKFQNGYYYYTISIPKKTPAIAEVLDEDRLKVYFESGENKFLVFGKTKNGRYGLYGFSEEDGFYVNFEGKRFRVAEGSRSQLLIKEDIKSEVETDKRKVKGLKLR